MANRLESTQHLQATMSVAVNAARSRIEDADYAVEVSSMAWAPMLQDTFASLMTKANQTPQVVFSLLNDSIK